MIPLQFERSEYAARLAKVRVEMARRGMDVLLVNDIANQHYLTGYDGWSFYTPQTVVVPIADEEPVWIGRAMDAAGGKLSCWMKPERIVGFPAKNATVSFAEVLAKCSKSMAEHFDFNLATRVDVSYVLWQRQAEDYRPLYIINVYGCEKIADYLPNEARFKRIRYLFNDEGEMLVFDNLL